MGTLLDHKKRNHQFVFSFIVDSMVAARSYPYFHVVKVELIYGKIAASIRNQKRMDSPTLIRVVCNYVQVEKIKLRLSSILFPFFLFHGLPILVQFIYPST
jgi:hypothetical protein